MSINTHGKWIGAGWYAVNFWLGDRYKWVEESSAYWYESEDDFPVSEYGERAAVYYGDNIYPDEFVNVGYEEMSVRIYENWSRIREIVEDMSYDEEVACIAVCNTVYETDQEAALPNPGIVSTLP